MHDAAHPLDAYLTSRFGFGLRQLLADAATGRDRPELAKSVTVLGTLVGTFRREDGGFSALYQGLMTVEGVIYRFRRSIFMDAGGVGSLESIGELESVRWGVGLAIPRGAEPLTDTARRPAIA